MCVRAGYRVKESLWTKDRAFNESQNGRKTENKESVLKRTHTYTHACKRCKNEIWRKVRVKFKKVKFRKPVHVSGIRKNRKHKKVKKNFQKWKIEKDPKRKLKNVVRRETIYYKEKKCVKKRSVNNQRKREKYMQQTYKKCVRTVQKTKETSLYSRRSAFKERKPYAYWRKRWI